MKKLYFPLMLAMLAWSAPHAEAQSVKPRAAKPSPGPTTMVSKADRYAATVDLSRGGIANDECAGATVLTINSSCITVSESAAGATETLPAILCNGFTSPEGNDVWFTFTATGPVTSIDAEGIGTFDVVMEAFTGTCGSLASIACADATFPPNNGTLESLDLATTVGTTYYVRVYSYWSPVPTDFGFTICAYSPAGTPANDLCTGTSPVSLAVGGSVNFTGDNTGALDTEGLGTPSVWHAFTTTECTSLTLNYCGTTPAFGNAFLNLFIGCPNTDFFASTSFNVTDCPDGNVTIYYDYVPAGTYYYAVLTDAATDAEGAYNITVSATACPAGYCAASADLCDEYIAEVNFGTINNASDCADGPAVDYTAISTDVAQGAVVPITVTNGPETYEGDQVVVWIDWNQNENFGDAGEAYTLTTADLAVTFTGNIAVPATATLGTTRMRIRMMYTGTPSPCGTSAYGEVEDYSVNVISGGGSTPANDDCTGAVPVSLSAGSTITLSGDNTGATVDAPTTFVIVWEAITTTECANIDIGYCVPGSEFEDFLVNLSVGCPDFITGVLTGTVSADNCTVSFLEVPAGTYYIPVLVDPALTPVGAYSISVSAVACPVGVYCSASSQDGTFEAIGNVTFADMNNTTTDELIYNDQTAVVATVTSGVDYPLSVSIFEGYATDQVLVWIDYDQSQSFEETELVFTSTPGVGPHATTVSIPLTAMMGNTRMRVRLHDTYVGPDYANTPNATPCGTSTYGQVEDYTVFVQGIITGVDQIGANDFSIFPNPSNGDITIQYGGADALVDVELMDMTGRLVYGERRQMTNGAQMPVALAGQVAAGTYVVRLTSPLGRSEQRVVVR